MKINELDYIVQLVDFPNKKVKESVAKNEDGTFTIFIESSLSREQQQKSFIHALKHITGDDFSKEDVEKIEKNAHEL